MRNDWLSIPDAPNYEINSQLICRNKKTGYILKKHHDKRKHFYYSVRQSGQKPFCRSPQFLRRIALATATPNSFEPIPSLGGRYEINKKGVVRNAATKKVLALKGHGKCVEVHYGQRKFIMRCVADLLWEVHGIILQRRFRPQPCTLENAHGKFSFPNLKAAARHIAKEISYSLSYVYKFFLDRKPQFDDWKISYPPRDLSGNIKWNARDLSALAKRQAKLDKEVFA